MNRHYFDFASTAPLRPEAALAIAQWLELGVTADPGRPFHEARVVSDRIEESRSAVAAMLGVRSRQVIFTSGGTEAVNWASHAAHHARPTAPILVSAVEHSAVRLSSERLAPVEVIPVDSFGRVELSALDDALSRSTVRPALVHCQLANHEVGTVQPVAELIARCHAIDVPVHVDACAAVGQIRVDAGLLEADFLSLSAHKFGGPTGLGALVVRRGTRPDPLLVGGDQERARRAGMESVLSIVGLGAVAEVLSRPNTIDSFSERSRSQTERIAKAALAVGEVVQYGDPVDRVPHVVCFGIRGVEAEGVVLGLDQAGLAVHSGSACSSESISPSPVLEAMGVDAERSLRCSVGWSTNDADVDAFESAFPKVVDSLRALAG